MRSLFEDFGVSSILVIGGSGDYFQVTVKSFRIALTSYSIIRSSAMTATLAKISLQNKHLRRKLDYFAMIFFARILYCWQSTLPNDW